MPSTDGNNKGITANIGITIKNTHIRVYSRVKENTDHNYTAVKKNTVHNTTT